MRPATVQPAGGRLFAGSILAFVLAGSVFVLAGLPWALVMPALATLLVTSGFVLAAGSYIKGQRMDAPDIGAGNYELAGALVFLGFAAALLADAEQALALLEQIERQGQPQ